MVKKKNKPKVSIASDDDARWKLAKSGDVEAQNSLVIEHEPLVYQIVGTMIFKFPEHIDADDLHSYGMLGLWKAVQTYDHTKATFRTHAAFRIRNAIYDELRIQDWAPITVRQKAKELNKIREEFISRVRRPPTDEELGDAIGKPEDWVRTFRQQLEATSHRHMEELELTYGSIEAVPDFSTSKQIVESGTLAAVMQQSFVSWLDGLPNSLKCLWVVVYYCGKSKKEAMDILGLRTYEMSEQNKRLLNEFRKFYESIQLT